MAIAIITGSSGLIGSEAAQFFHEKGFEIVGIDNDLRSYFFGKESSTAWNTQRLSQKLNRLQILLDAPRLFQKIDNL